MIKDLNDLFNDGVITEASASSGSSTIKGALGDFLSDTKNDITNVKDTVGTLKAIDKTVGNVGGVVSDLDRVRKSNTYDNRSIIARARKSVLQFPIYITQTMRPNEAQIISKLFERVYTTLVQTVLSQNQIISEDEVNDLLFIKNFHTNIKESGDLLANVYYRPIDDIDEMMTESVVYSERISPSMSVKFRWIPSTECPELIKENTRLMNEPLEGLSYLKEDSIESLEKKSLKEDEVKDSDDEFERIAEDLIKGSTANEQVDDIKDKIEDLIKNKGNAGVYQKKMNELINPYKSNWANMSADERKKAEEDQRKRARVLKDLTLYTYRNGKFYLKKGTTESSTKTVRDHKFVPAVKAPILLKDADIKKINGMLPYTIEASFIVKGPIAREVKFIIGVKSVLHPIRVQDLADDLRELVTGDMKKLRKVRYKTGEINFMDYMFNIKGIKADAAKRINYNKRWLNTLKRLGEYKKLNGSLLKNPVKLLTNGETPIPNGTLILSQADVTMLTDQTGIDLSKVRNAKRLAKSIFLIAIAIVDSAAGTMRVLFPDSDTDWDVQSLAAIDAEVSKTDNSPLLREMQRLINK